LIFIIIEIFGIIFWHSADESCSRCDGTGEVWSTGIPYFGIPSGWVNCSSCRGTGLVWRPSALAAAAIYTPLFIITFFVLFYLAYFGSLMSATANPWVIKVDRMDGPFFNPMYTTWLFVRDRRRWAAFYTVVTVLVTPICGWIIFLFLTDGKITVNNHYLGFSIGLAYLALLGFYWYKGYWKPRTREEPPPLPHNVEAEWRDKRL
jgi:hypothetical protein